jgi:predicted GIY-YIG superfamily endonuclease
VNKLLFKEEFSSRIEATKRESQIKGWTKRKKLALVNGDLSLLKKL